ncbi:MAG: hydantoinase/oxoprolinase family protein [Deferribacterota bacterium]|nr:hydantoinase/oxoprolinase family protein [Deferribacterota bacterium]
MINNILMIVIGVDTGGTFTDFVYYKDGKWGVLKLLSDPKNPGKVVIEGKNIIAGENKDIILIHGSTVATNAILEKKGAKAALITNKGFEDIIDIGRQNRSQLYNLKYRKTQSLISPEHRYGVKCRVDYSGTILKDLDSQEVENIIEELINQGIESVAVCLLFSFKEHKHERIIGELLKKSGFYYSLSSEILNEFREYERMSTTVVNTYVGPKIARYLQFLKDNMGLKGFSIMQSNGGIISADTAINESVRTVLSGPAGGVIGAYEIGKFMGIDKLITFDMGGTSTDVSLIDKEPILTTESKIDEYPIKVPMISIHTVGAGGGSIAFIDKGGALRVGPISAGADPGPICYGKGEEITVTDANCFLNRLLPDYFLGGKMRLDKHRLYPFFEKLAKKANLDVGELAEGVISISNTVMEKAIRVITIEKGFDPKEFTLFTFGGAGALHACFLAKLLNIPRVLIPQNPGTLSAIGMVLADVVKDYSKTVMLKENEIKTNELKDLLKDLCKRATKDLLFEGIDEKDILLEKFLDMRYVGQSYEITVPFVDNFIDVFHKEHERLYGYANRGKETEVVNIRLRAIGKREKLKLERSEETFSKIDDRAIICKRDVIFDGKTLKTDIYKREYLRNGNVIKPPAIIVEHTSTIVVPPFCTASVDEIGNVILELES